MRIALMVFFVLVLATMTWVTITASLEQDVLTGGGELWPDPWFRATLADAYFAFLTVWLWMAYREPTWLRRLAWLVAVLLLGNFAIAAYMLLRLARWRQEDGMAALLLRPSHRP